MESQGCLLRVELDGEVVLEAPLIVHNQSKAWEAFITAYPTLMHMAAGEILETVKVACNNGLLAQVGPQTALSIKLQTPSSLVIPKQADVPADLIGAR